MNDLSTLQCESRVTAEGLLDSEQLQHYLSQLHTEWRIVDHEKHKQVLAKNFSCNNFAEAIKIVNATARIAEQEDHHPDICFGWGYCNIEFTTHSAGGLTLNDFICAVKIDQAT